MKIKKFRTFVGDFETTVFKGQTYTEVWASAIVELYTEDAVVLHSIEDTFNYLSSFKENVRIYYHNLKFDGNFWLAYLLSRTDYKQAYTTGGNENHKVVQWLNDADMPHKSYKYSISDKGQWYTIIIRTDHNYIEIRDSLKLLPFSVRKLGKDFKTKHQKLEMEYVGLRYEGCEITPVEMEYIKNDVFVVKEVLEIMFNEGHDKLTIGSCCLEEYKRLMTKPLFESSFPNMYEIPLDEDVYGFDNAGEYIRKSYRGGWCYVVKNKTNKVYENGVTADVNSLYPSMMSSESGNVYPVGEPTFWNGNFIPKEALSRDKFFFVRIRTRFYLKENYLPFIQIKGNYLYRGTECLETSDVYDKKSGKYVRFYYDEAGRKCDTAVTMTMTMVDLRLFLEHYRVEDFEVLSGCYFEAILGIFDDYINKYKMIKMREKGAKRQLAKLFLNNLYGKMASSTDSSFKIAYINDEGGVGFYSVNANEKKPGYIPIGSAITSYARNFTIRCAQMNYYGENKRGFIYADTDSIHCDLSPDELKGLKVDENAFCCWKLESCWDKGIFVRQKTYIEHVTHEDLKEVEHPYYNVKCAGMPDKCKRFFIQSVTQNYTEDDLKELTDEEVRFVTKPRKMTDFKVGLAVPGKLRPVRIKGGVLLVDTPYVMRAF